MSTRHFTIQESSPPGLVAFRARILAAVPGKSLNGRIYTAELLKQTAPLYPSDGINPRPFTLDHDIEHCERVIGMITGATYGVQEAMNGRPVEGLWLEAIGYMDKELFAKVVGTKEVPPFIRGVSIGGEGEGEWTGNGVLIRSFKPAELAMTPFPGIPTAHIAQINMIREHYLNSNNEGKKMSIQIQEKDLSLEEAEKQAAHDSKNPRKTREGPLPPPDRGANDSRPGLPAPTVRTNVLHVQPMATTSPDAGFKLNPEASTANKPRIGGKAPSGKYAKGGYTTTQTPGYGKLSKSGTGLPEQEAAPGTAAGAGAQGSRDAKATRIKIPKTGNTTTTHPGYGNLTPSGTGMDSEDEESMQDLGDQTNPLPMSQDQPSTQTDLKRSKSPTQGKPNVNSHAKEAEEEEEEESEEEESATAQTWEAEEEGEEEEEEEGEEEHGPSPHIPGRPVGKTSKHSADDTYDSPADPGSKFGGEPDDSRTRSHKQKLNQNDEPVGVTPGAKAGTDSSDDRPEEEEEEEEADDGVSLDPVRKVAGQGQHIRANPTKEESTKILFSEAEPIQARAFSLPTSSGILKTLAQIAAPDMAREAVQKGDVEELVKQLTRPNHTMSPENVAKLLENWNKGKVPPEPKTQKIVVRKPGIGQSKDMSIPQARKAPAIAEGVVKTKSVTAVAPTMGASTISTIPTSRLNELMAEESKRPYSPVSYLNLAKRTWNRAVEELLEFR
jgi:hypothetical protein